MPERGRCFSIGQATLSGPVTVDEERLEAAARNSVGEKGEQKDKWPGGARKGSLWLCYAGPLVERHKSEISGNRRKPKPILYERDSWKS